MDPKCLPAGKAALNIRSDMHCATDSALLLSIMLMIYQPLLALRQIYLLQVCTPPFTLHSLPFLPLMMTQE